MTNNLNQWAYSWVKKSFLEYARGIHEKPTLEWALGVGRFALEKEWLSQDEIGQILDLLVLTASDSVRKGRLELLRPHLKPYEVRTVNTINQAPKS